MFSVIDMPATNAPVAERVAFGAKTLDELAPEWFRKIEKDRLDIASGSECVIGQVFEGCCFGCKLDALNIIDYKANLGFDIPTGYDSYSVMKSWYNDLKVAWLVEIDQRLAAATAVEATV
ncbi:hypothetical protein GCM10010149_87890 [Nonomuraea roseoviolacea subsp. roseoviolacea]|uniref:hypothetical protein n=1 Tax=Nonomuraea roseoviolacea TaxID=103837 RepID=UPI0031CED28C